MKRSCFYALIFLSLCGIGAQALAAPKKARVNKCDTVIADPTTGSYSNSRTSNREAFRCFKTSKDAQEAGYVPRLELKNLDFSGWWRIKLTKINDSCGKYGSKTDLVLFLQILQNGKSVFTDYCPSTGQQVGTRTESGVSVSKTRLANEPNSSLACSGGNVEITEHLQIDRVVEGGATYLTKLTQVRRCADPAEGAQICTTVFSGNATPETHKIWPEVSDNSNSTQEACNSALDKCARCHDNLTDPGFVR